MRIKVRLIGTVCIPLLKVCAATAAGALKLAVAADGLKQLELLQR